MCGIAGIFDMSSGPPVAEGELAAMIRTMAHRGPDAHGTLVMNARTGFAHARLAILDLVPESNQPFEIDGGAYVMTYNGEIFNYVELREELEALGHRFRTRSDTEVLLRAYATWGAAAIPKLNGMWAFAIYDRERDELFCSRDRFGIKPFHWAQHDGRFLFASEIKAMLAAAPALARPDYESLALLLRFSVSGARRRTTFEGVERLPAAHNMVVTRHGVQIERYWDYPTDVDDDMTPEEAAAGLRRHLVDALKLRMRSDVPVGATLSGGIDSSAIVCLLRTFTDQPFETFTASYGAGDVDESAQAHRLATSLGMTPNLLPAEDESFLPTLRKIVWHLDVPSASSATFPLWNIMRRAREKVTVLLEGQGADELLAGYVNICFPAAALERLGRGDLAGAGAIYAGQARRLGWRRTAMYAARDLSPAAHRLFRRMRGDDRVYAGPLRDLGRERPMPRAEPPVGDPLNRLLRWHHEHTLVNLLHYGDAMSMAHSIESRLPFMDYRLVEFGFRMPARLKFRGARGKMALRDAVRGDVPAEILDSTQKLGFPVPIARWFRERPDLTVDPILNSDCCRERGLYDRAALERVLAEHRAGRADLAPVIFRWIITEVWFQTFIDGR